MVFQHAGMLQVPDEDGLESGVLDESLGDLPEPSGASPKTPTVFGG